MRPRADHKRDIGTEEDQEAGVFTDPLKARFEPISEDIDSDEEPEPEADREDASVILRRGITFGPELGPEETEHTTKDRGIYFTCYQSDIRDGFNLLMTRMAPSFSLALIVHHETDKYYIIRLGK